MQLQMLTPPNWQDYELIDSGGFEKLERFGKYYLSRPEPQAIWDKKLSDSEWEQMAHAMYVREKGNDERRANSERGKWLTSKGIPDNWTIGYEYNSLIIKMKVALTSFGHVGVFPEQASNWNFIFEQVKKLESPRILNLFAYTGAASLAARGAGGDVVHLDSIKQTVNWSRENMDLSALDNIHWVVEDAMTFVKREVKRGKQYHGIILDPPAYGRGPDGEKWILEEELNEMISLCAKLLIPGKNFLVLNLYSIGLSGVVAHTLLQSHFAKANIECGELVIESKTKQQLPLGVFARFGS